MMMLRDGEADIEMRDNFGRTAFWYAVAKGNIHILDALIAGGADVDAFDYNLQTPWHVMFTNGHTKVLLQVIIHAYESGVRLKFFVCFFQFFMKTQGCRLPWREPTDVTTLTVEPSDIVELLLDELCLIDICPPNVDCVFDFFIDRLTSRCRKYSEETLQWFHYRYAQCLACDIRNDSKCDMVVRLTNYLLHKFSFVKTVFGHFINKMNDTDDDLEDMTVIRFYDDLLTSKYSEKASHHFYYESLRMFCHPSGTHTDSHSTAAMHWIPDLQCMRSLLEKGNGTEAENVDGLRPIHCAVRMGIIELVELLIQHGADVNAADVVGNRPLHEAVCHDLNIVQLLVQNGAKLNVQNIYGETPLHVAVEHQQPEVCMFLLNAGADIRLTDIWRNTPLHYLTACQLQCSEYEERVLKRTKKYQHLLTPNAVGVTALSAMATYGVLDYVNHKQEMFNDISTANETGLCSEQLTRTLPSSVIYCLLELQHIKAFSKIEVYCRKESAIMDCYGNTPTALCSGSLCTPRNVQS